MWPPPPGCRPSKSEAPTVISPALPALSLAPGRPPAAVPAPRPGASVGASGSRTVCRGGRARVSGDRRPTSTAEEDCGTGNNKEQH